MTLKEQIRAAWKANQYKTTADLVRQFGCDPSTVQRALQDIREDDGRTLGRVKHGRKYVPLPELGL